MTCHHTSLFIVLLFLNLTLLCISVSEKECSLNYLFSCPEEETCVQKSNSDVTGVCKCRIGFEYSASDGHCKPVPKTNSEPESALPDPASVYSPGSSASALAAGLLVPLFIIGAIASLVVASRRFGWIQRIRNQAQQMRTRNYDTVLVNQDDDPPLA